MSSILKALKKAEQSSERHAAQKKFTPGNAQWAHDRKHASFLKHTGFRLFLIIGPVLLFILGLSFYRFYPRRPALSPPPSSSTAVQPDEKRIRTEPSDPGRFKPQAHAALEHLSIKKAPAPQEQPMPPDDEPPTPEPMVLADGTLLIQAISWTRTPENRIVVINNSVLAEKDMISDYRIEQINMDDVVLSRSGRKYILKFKHP